MSKSIIKVKIEPCGKKAKDREEKVYPINFLFSNPEQQYMRGEIIQGVPTTIPNSNHYKPGETFRARLLASGEIEIL